MNNRRKAFVSNPSRGRRNRKITVADEKTGDFCNLFDGKGPIRIKATEKKDIMNLQKGKIMKTETNSWKILCSLGDGGYGAVYEVAQRNSKTETSCALKVEPAMGERADLRLKVELRVLTELQRKSAQHCKHFVELVDRGKSQKFKFMVMTLVGPSLHDIRRKMLSPEGFSNSTAMQIIFQTLTSLQDLHSIGWIHRDVKLTNFCIGLGDKLETVILLDFGIARRYLDKETKAHKPQRKGRRVVGTARYMPINAHLGMDQSRRDDLESWVYVAYDTLHDIRGLPWRTFHPVNMFNTICKLKMSFMAGRPINGCPEEPLLEKFRHVTVYVGKIVYGEDPDYGHIKSMLMSICNEFRIDLNSKLDWISQD